MRLPNENKLKSKEMRTALHYDVNEFFNVNDRCGSKYRYMSRFFAISELVKSLFSKGEQCKILDVGCGQGNYSLTLAKMHETIGIDIRTELIKYAIMKKEREEDARFVACNAEELCFKDESFDLVLMLEVIEHLTDPEKAMKKISRTLKPGGFLIVSTPNGGCIVYINKLSFRRFLRIPSEERKSTAYSIDLHTFLFKERDLWFLLEHSGFQVVEVRRINSIALGIPWFSFLWLPSVFRQISLATFRQIETMIETLPIIGPTMTTGLIFVAKKKVS